MVLCRPGRNPSVPHRRKKKKRGFSQLEFKNYSCAVKRAAHAQRQEHMTTCMACVFTVAGSHTHPHDQFPSATHSTFTLSILQRRPSTTPSREKSVKFHQALLPVCSPGSIPHFHKSYSISLRPLPSQSMALASTQLDK